MSDESFGRILRDAADTETLQIPGAPFALAGKLIEHMGFPAAYLSGGAMSAGIVGVPDIGLTTLTELVQQTKYLANGVEIPVIVDADTGFGDTVNVERTVAELEAAGAAAIQLEDQQLPKRCGHLSGKSLVTMDEMCSKIRAAAAVRYDDDTIIIARTDARSVEGMESAVDRAQRYLDAGADWIFPEALADLEEFTSFQEAVDAPLMANMTEFGKSALLDLEQFQDLGYAAVIYPVSLLRVAMRAMQAALAMIADEGTQVDLLDLMQTREELYDLLDYDDYGERDKRYAGE